MCPRGTVAAGLFALLALLPGTGCSLFRGTVAYDKSGQPDTPRSAAPIADPMAASRIVMQTRLIDQPAGDDYLSRGMWTSTTDPLPHELSARLAANGLRVGVVSGQMPGELEKLAASDAAVVSPMQRTFLPGQPKAVPVNGPLEAATASVVADLGANPAKGKWKAAECGVVVTATPEPDGRLKVRCEFHIQHGDRQQTFFPNADGTAFDGRQQRPTETFPALAFDITLRRGDVLLFGAADDPAGTLGQLYFFPPEADRLRQRVLLIQPFSAEPSRAPLRATPASLAAKR